MGAFTSRVGMPAAMTVIMRGYPRHTDDIDATVWAPGVAVPDVLSALARHGMNPRTSDALAFAAQTQMLLVQHTPSAMDLDISLAWLPFEDEAIARATPVDIGDARIPTAAVEDLIVYKFAAWRERDRTDIEQLLIRHSGSLDLARIERYVHEFGEVLEDPDRVREFEALFRRAIAP